MSFLSRLVPQCLRRAVQISETEADVYYSRPVLLSRLTRSGKRWVDSAGRQYDSTLDAAEHLAQLHMAGQLPGAVPATWVPRRKHTKMGAAARAARSRLAASRRAGAQPQLVLPVPTNRTSLRLQLQLLTEVMRLISAGELTEDQAVTMLAEMGTQTSSGGGTPQTTNTGATPAPTTTRPAPTGQEVLRANLQLEKHLVTHSTRD